MADENPINATLEPGFPWKFPEPPYVLRSGRGPVNLLQNWYPLRLNDLLIFAAWAHGVRAGQRVHVLPLFAYMQSHLTKHSGLQGHIEKAAQHWRNVERGVYEFTPHASAEAARLFGPPRVFADISARYVFTRRDRDLEVSTIVLPGHIEVELNGSPVKGTAASERLAAAGIHLSATGSQPYTIWSWITDTADFEWAREEQRVPTR